MNIKFIDHPSQLDVVITYLGQHDKFCVDLETTPQEEYR